MVRCDIFTSLTYCFVPLMSIHSSLIAFWYYLYVYNLTNIHHVLSYVFFVFIIFISFHWEFTWAEYVLLTTCPLIWLLTFQVREWPRKFIICRNLYFSKVSAFTESIDEFGFRHLALRTLNRWFQISHLINCHLHHCISVKLSFLFYSLLPSLIIHCIQKLSSVVNQFTNFSEIRHQQMKLIVSWVHTTTLWLRKCANIRGIFMHNWCKDTALQHLYEFWSECFFNYVS